MVKMKGFLVEFASNCLWNLGYWVHIKKELLLLVFCCLIMNSSSCSPSYCCCKTRPDLHGSKTTRRTMAETQQTLPASLVWLDLGHHPRHQAQTTAVLLVLVLALACAATTGPSGIQRE
jgi:hypothetical protein